jgi:hypothetical protein
VWGWPREQKEVSLRTPRGTFRFGLRRPGASSKTKAPASRSSDGATPPEVQSPAAPLAAPPPPQPPDALAHDAVGVQSPGLEVGVRWTTRDEPDRPGEEEDGAPAPAYPAPQPSTLRLRPRLLSRATTVLPHPTGTVHVRKAGLPARLRAGSRVGRMRTTSTAASAIYQARPALTLRAAAPLRTAAPRPATPKRSKAP